MFDAFYEQEADRIRTEIGNIEEQLYHEKPVDPQHDSTRRERSTLRSRAVYAQTEFAPDMAEWHSVPYLQPSLRVRGKTIDLDSARVRTACCSWVSFCHLLSDSGNYHLCCAQLKGATAQEIRRYAEEALVKAMTSHLIDELVKRQNTIGATPTTGKSDSSARASASKTPSSNSESDDSDPGIDSTKIS